MAFGGRFFLSFWSIFTSCLYSGGTTRFHFWGASSDLPFRYFLTDKSDKVDFPSYLRDENGSFHLVYQANIEKRLLLVILTRNSYKSVKAEDDTAKAEKEKTKGCALLTLPRSGLPLTLYRLTAYSSGPGTTYYILFPSWKCLLAGCKASEKRIEQPTVITPRVNCRNCSGCSLSSWLALVQTAETGS